MNSDSDSQNKNIRKFIEYMLEWSKLYPELAGCRLLSVCCNHEVKEESFDADSGDFVIYDERNLTGTYRIDHEDARPYEVSLVDPGANGVDYALKPIKRKVDAPTLIWRVQWFMSLFVNLAHRRVSSPVSIWDDSESIENAYAVEKEHLSGDDHLALYWLMHFGFVMDDRYHDVKAVTDKNDLSKITPMIGYATSFFDCYSPLKDIPFELSHCSNDRIEDLKNLYLIRRSFLLYETGSLEFVRGEGGLLCWWMSVKMYPHAEPYMPERVLWLVKNIQNFSQWDSFNRLLNQEKDIKLKNISLFSFVEAMTPGNNRRSECADKVLHELYDCRQSWSPEISSDSIATMMWMLRDYISDKNILVTLAKMVTDTGDFPDADDLDPEHHELKDDQDYQDYISIINWVHSIE